MSYIKTVGRFVLGTGLMFQLPVVIYFLTKFGLVTPQQLRQYRQAHHYGSITTSKRSSHSHDWVRIITSLSTEKKSIQNL